MMSRSILRSALWLSLGTWVGSWAFFAFVVSRIAFQVLPGDIAGDLAGSLLTILHFWGAAAGFVVAAAAVGLGRRGLVVALPVALAIVCLISELWLSPEVAAVRPSTLGEASTAESQLRFSRLHGLSLGIFMAVHLVSAVLIVLFSRLDSRDPSPQEESTATVVTS